MFIQIARGHDLRILQPRIIQNAAHEARYFEEVAAVDTHAPQRVSHARCDAGAFHWIVSIDQVNGAVSEERLQSAECLFFRGEGHHPRMCRGTHYRYPVTLPGQNIAGARASADISGPRGKNTGFRRVRAAGSELDDIAPACFVRDECRLSGDQCFKSNSRQQVGFRQLRLNKRRAKIHDGLTGVQNGTFRNCHNVAGKAEVRQIFPESRGDVLKTRQATKVQDISRLKAEIQQILAGAVQPRGDYKFAIPRQTPDGEFEGSNLSLFPGGEVTCRHRQFVEVRQEGIQAISSFRSSAPRTA